MTEKRIALIGLGLLGTAIAERLLGASFAVSGFDSEPSRREQFRGFGGQVASDQFQAAKDCSRILLSLPTSDTVEDVVDGLKDTLRPGQIIIDTTTGSPNQVIRIGESLSKQGVEYLDATVSGSSGQARKGEIIFMIGGNEKAFQACCDIFDCCARKWFHVGPVGSGSRMKLVSNLVLGLNRAALAEGLTLAGRMGLDSRLTLTVLAESAAYSRAMDVKGSKMIEGDFSPQARLSQHLKDVLLILDEAEIYGARLPLSNLHRSLLEVAESAGFGEVDNSAIIRAFDLLTEDEFLPGLATHDRD